MIVVGSCYFLFTLLIPYDPNIDFVFPLTTVYVIVVQQVAAPQYISPSVTSRVLQELNIRVQRSVT